MGGAVKAVAAPVKQAAKSVANVATVGLYNAATTKGGNFFENAATGFVGGVTGYDTAKAGVASTSKLLADMTGATAATEGLQAQIAQSASESRRQALLSDEMAKAAGGEGARVSLNTGRRRLGMNQAATGISGSASSKGTGVQA